MYQRVDKCPLILTIMSLKTYTKKDLLVHRISGSGSSALNGRQLRRYFDKKMKKTKSETPVGLFRSILISKNSYF